MWGPSVVKSWNQVANEASRAGKYVHLGKLFGIRVEKVSELDDEDERKKYIFHVVFQGNQVVGQSMNEAQFQDMVFAFATVEASLTCIMKGLLEGNCIDRADAMQAYIQAKLGGTEAWVEIPQEGWPEEWKKNGAPSERSCYRLDQEPYGHPDSGTVCEKHAIKMVLSLGLEVVAESWPSCYLHRETDLCLAQYVDDFLMSGPKEEIAKEEDCRGAKNRRRWTHGTLLGGASTKKVRSLWVTEGSSE